MFTSKLLAKIITKKYGKIFIYIYVYLCLLFTRKITYIGMPLWMRITHRFSY